MLPRRVGVVCREMSHIPHPEASKSVEEPTNRFRCWCRGGGVTTPAPTPNTPSEVAMAESSTDALPHFLGGRGALGVVGQTEVSVIE